MCMYTHTNICKLTLTLPPQERMFVRKECLSFSLQKNCCAKHFSLFPMQQHSSRDVHSGPSRAQLFFLQPALSLPDVLSNLTKQSLVEPVSFTM